MDLTYDRRAATGRSLPRCPHATGESSDRRGGTAPGAAMQHGDILAEASGSAPATILTGEKLAGTATFAGGVAPNTGPAPRHRAGRGKHPADAAPVSISSAISAAPVGDPAVTGRAPWRSGPGRA
ncbi:hypothetical protein AB0346_30880, partial [Nocardia beijingensis]